MFKCFKTLEAFNRLRGHPKFYFNNEGWEDWGGGGVRWEEGGQTSTNQSQVNEYAACRSSPFTSLLSTWVQQSGS